MATTPAAEAAALEAYPDDFASPGAVDDLRAAFAHGWTSAYRSRARKAAAARWESMTPTQREAATRPARRASGRL